VALLVEHLLPSDAAQYTPGAGGLAIAIQEADTPLAPSVALALVLYSVAASAVEVYATVLRDAD
jgi:hypothetical protein